LELGHRQIGILALGLTGADGALHDSDSYPSRQRLGGWREVLAEAGIDPVVALAPYEPREAAIAAARRLLESAPLTAVLCFSDVFAHAVVLAAEELGRSVPDDLSVVGYDDAPFARTVRPTLTTVRQDVSAKGHLAAGMLADLLAGRAAQSQLLPATLVVRESTAPLDA
jgi:DNA-binding LacI/PurR family transcriptional regulator